MPRKTRNLIKAPEVDRRELQWLRDRLSPQPTNPELMQVDDNSEEFDEDDIEDYQPPAKIPKLA